MSDRRLIQLTRTNFTHRQAVDHVRKQFINSFNKKDIFFDWLEEYEIRRLLRERVEYDQAIEDRTAISNSKPIGLVKKHNHVIFVNSNEIYLIDVIHAVKIRPDGKIDDSVLQRTLKKYQDLKNETDERIKKKFLIFTNSQMLIEFENYISLSADAKEELEKHLIRTGVIFFPLFQNDATKENGISQFCDNEELNCEQIIEQMKTGFVNFDKLSDDIKTEISYILERTNKITGGELEYRKAQDRKANRNRRR